jgi:hypothetical protein
MKGLVDPFILLISSSNLIQGIIDGLELHLTFLVLLQIQGITSAKIGIK